MFKDKNHMQLTIDPVCLMRVDPHKDHPRFTYRMRTYHFCADSCLRAFENDPERYLEPQQVRKKKLWRRYLDRLNKITGGKPPSCCG